jgi:hypothetical protein
MIAAFPATSVAAAPAPKPAAKGKARRSSGAMACAARAAPTSQKEDPTGLKDSVIEGYLRAIRGGASPRETRSVTENLDIFIEILPRPTILCARRCKRLETQWRAKS